MPRGEPRCRWRRLRHALHPLARRERAQRARSSDARTAGASRALADRRKVRACPSPCYAPSMAAEVAIARLKAAWFALLAKVTRASKAESRDLKPWLGSLRATGRITGDIASPAVPENEWEAGRR